MASTSRILIVAALALVALGCSDRPTLETAQPSAALDGTWVFTLNSNPRWGYSCTGDLQSGVPPVCVQFIADIAQDDGTFQAVNLRVPEGADPCTLLSLTGTVAGGELSGVLRYLGEGSAYRDLPGRLELAFTGSTHPGSNVPYLYLKPGRMTSEGARGSCSLSTYLYTARPVDGPI